MVNVSDAVNSVLCDGNGRLGLQAFIKYKKAMACYMEKQYKTPKPANEDERYATEYEFYNAVTPDQEGCTVHEYGALNGAADALNGKKIKAYEDAKLKDPPTTE